MTTTGAPHKQRVFTRIAAPEKNCRDCGQSILDGTASSLKAGKCRRCYNLWFREWVFTKASEGTLTGTRAKLNAKPNLHSPGAGSIPATQQILHSANADMTLSRLLAWKRLQP